MAKRTTPAKATGAIKADVKTQSARAVNPAVILNDTLARLETLGTEKMRAYNAKNGAGDNQFGVALGDVRLLAKKIKTNHELALSLWRTGNIDAQFLATLLIEVGLLSAAEMDGMVKSVTYLRVADWLHSHVVKVHAEREVLRKAWMTASDAMAARAGWALTAGRVAKSPDGLDFAALLDRIETEMGSAAPAVQWTMNCCLAEIGIHSAKHRKRAVAIGEKLGVYRDYPCSKGCTSPFAPTWIGEMVRRQG